MIKFTRWALALSSLLSATAFTARADEGMWLPLYLAKLNYADMQKAGLKLSAEQLYSVNKSSLKDAVVSFGGFCTGEIISPEGLVLTNHHCGYDAIQSHSSVEKNYLKDGFWAYKKEEELPNEGLFAKFLVRMEDVSARVLSKVNDGMSEADRTKAANDEMKVIKEEAATKENGYDAEVKPFFDGNEYYLMVYETYKDVRLVGTPPESVGKFGGDTDNWMWPRHTGDFSLFRVYMGKDGKPAAYSKDNVPLKPKHFLPISTSGVKEGDFTMVFGFPGRTNRFLSSYGVKMALDITNPSTVAIRDIRLKTMKENMDENPAVRIKYASKYAQIANYWKYFIGQSQGLNRLDVVDKKLAEETAFQQWADADPTRQAKYGKALTDLGAAYEKQRKFAKVSTYMREAAFAPEVISAAGSMSGMLKMLRSSATKPEDVTKASEGIKGSLAELYKDYDQATDKAIFIQMMKMFVRDVPSDQQPDVFSSTLKSKYQGDVSKWADDLYNQSGFVSQAKAEAVLAAKDTNLILKDPAYQLFSSIADYSGKLTPQVMPIQAEIGRCNRLYVDGTRQLLAGKKKFYPNANSTMRVTYGKIGSYKPRDGAYYENHTTLDGIMEKEDPTNEEFVVPAKLKEIYQKKDYGLWAENGTVNVGFIGNTDITGGNSGSPVINANGELIGLAFDGNWEAMSGDIAFEPRLQRTISCDIRYVMLMIDKYANAQNLINELKLVDSKASATSKAVNKKMAPVAKSKK